MTNKVYRSFAVTQNLAFLSYWNRKKSYAAALLTGIMSKRSLQNLLLESCCVIVAVIKNYSTKETLNVSPENHKF
jgi:hypothetical protein